MCACSQSRAGSRGIGVFSAGEAGPVSSQGTGGQSTGGQCTGGQSTAEVIVASTRAASGEYEDRSGALAVAWLRDRGFEVPEAIIARLARAETFTAGQSAYSDGIASSPHTKGWIRGLEPDACQLCRWWWREGRVWPKAHPMPTHKGCTCSPIPVVRAGIKSTGHTRRLAVEAAIEGVPA